MKISIVLGTLLFSSFTFSQTKLQIFAPKAYFSSSLMTNCPVFDLNQYTFQLNLALSNSQNEFSIYNKRTKWNDFYEVKKDTFYYRKSVYIPENTIFMPNTDSFNPNGAPNFGTAVLAGLINSIVRKL